MAGAIQEGLVSPDTVFDDVYQTINVGGTDYEDVEEHASTMTVADILAQSSNVGTIRIARQLGKDRFADYLHAFGFGQPTGLGLPGESSGSSFDASELHRHEHGVDPDRLRHRGHRRCRCSTSTRPSPTTGWPARRAWSRRPSTPTASATTKPLPAPHQVVSPGDRRRGRRACSRRWWRPRGTGVKAQIPGYPVAGKTGTARKAPYDTGRVQRVVRRVRPGRRPPPRGHRGDRQARRAASSAPTPPPPCSSRSCGSRSATSGCRPTTREPAVGARPSSGPDRAPGTLTRSIP